MKRLVFFVLVCALIGCSSTQIPSYIQEKKPFERRFYADFSRVLAAANQALRDLGWEVDKELEPQTFEVVNGEDGQENILLITKVRETRMFLGTRYARMNIYIRSKDEISDVEMRFFVINDLFFFKPKNFGNDALAQRFFARMQVHLGQ